VAAIRPPSSAGTTMCDRAGEDRARPIAASRSTPAWLVAADITMVVRARLASRAASVSACLRAW